MFEFGTVFDRTEINIDSKLRVPFSGNLAEGGINTRFARLAESGSDGKEIKIVLEPGGSVFTEDSAFSAAVSAAEVESSKPVEAERGDVIADALKSFAQESFRLRVCGSGELEIVAVHYASPRKRNPANVMRRTAGTVAW